MEDQHLAKAVWLSHAANPGTRSRLRQLRLPYLDDEEGSAWCFRNDMLQAIIQWIGSGFHRPFANGYFMLPVVIFYGGVTARRILPMFRARRTEYTYTTMREVSATFS